MNEQTGETCAIKEFSPSSKGCKREVEFLRLFSHVRISIEIHMCTLILTRGEASIIRYMDHDTALSFVAVEWVQGGTLDDQHRDRPFTYQEVQIVVHDILDALSDVHSRGVIHHDVKPQNILVSVLWSLIPMQSAND